MNEEKTIHIAPPKRIEKAGFFVLIMLGLFLLFEALGSLRTLNIPSTPVDTISVSGTGQVSLAPDIARVTFSVIQSASTAAAAQAAATKQGNTAIAAVKAQGIADEDIATLSYNISPTYSYSNCPPGALCPVYNGGGTPTITGYQVSETAQVTIRDLDKVSALVQALGQLNVQNVSGPDFTLESPTAGSDAARAKAIDNAKQEAELLAKQLGVSLGRVVSFNESGGPYPMYGVGVSAKSADAGVPAPNLPQGENTYSSTVSITYEIH